MRMSLAVVTIESVKSLPERIARRVWSAKHPLPETTGGVALLFQAFAMVGIVAGMGICPPNLSGLSLFTELLLRI